MVEIPGTLIQKLEPLGARFIRVAKKEKKPIDDAWAKNPMYAENPILQEWFSQGGNYGVTCGYGLAVLDADSDEIKGIIKTRFPSSFIVETGNKGVHYYFISNLKEKMYLKTSKGEHGGEILWDGFQVLGPGCVHPNGNLYRIVNDVPFTRISRDELSELLGSHLIAEKDMARGEETAKETRRETKFDLDITQLINLSSMRKQGDEYYGSHPVHGSDTGHNFWVNPLKNVWHCFRCDSGGGPWELLAMQEGIIDCKDAGRGSLRGELFKRVLEKARERGYIKEVEKVTVKSKKKEKTEENTREKIIGFFDENYKFYCDRLDPDLTLYVWIDDSWQPIAEGIFLKHLAEFEEEFKEKPAITKDGLLDYFKGRGQSTEVVEKPSTLIAFKNGLYNLETKHLEAHNPKYFIVNVIPHNFNLEAECPNWLKFLGEVHYEDDLDFIQEWWGYNLTTSYSAKAFLVMLGAGDNGKSVELTAIQQCLGHKNVTNITMQNINNPNGYHLATLYRKLANIADDIPNSKIRLSGNLKIASDGGWLNARPIYGHPFDFQNYAKITNSCNEPPEIEDDSEAVWTRMKPIEFPYTFKPKPDLTKGEKQARNRDELDKELAEEAEGILNWMVNGLHRLILNGYRFSYSVSIENLRKYYKIMSNPMAFFVDTCLEYTADETDVIVKKDLYPKFREWCNQQGLNSIPSSQKFFKFLKDAGIEAIQSRDYDMERVYKGYVCNNVTGIQLHLKRTVQNKLPISEGETK